MARREAILADARAEIRQGRAIIMASAGNGLIARCLDEARVDFIGVFPAGRYAMMGMGRLGGQMPFFDANRWVLDEVSREILPHVSRPVIAPVWPGDPRWKPEQLLKEIKDRGYAGVNNWPTITMVNDGPFRKELEDSGISYRQEAEFFALARAFDLVSIAYAGSEDDIRLAAEAKSDFIAPHLGLTAGETRIRARKSLGRTLDEAVKRTKELTELAQSIYPETILLNHGGPISSPDTVAYVISKTKSVGCCVGLPIENVGLERAVADVANSFRSVRLPKKRPRK